MLDKTNPQPIIEKVVAAKRKEIEAGVEGFMVYDLGLVQPCRQLWACSPRYSPSSAKVTANSLLTLPPGGVTVNGLKRNIKVLIYTVNYTAIKQDENLASHILKVGVLFIASWLKGEGVVEVDGSVEDSATAEISRSQVLLAVAPRNCLS